MKTILVFVCCLFVHIFKVSLIHCRAVSDSSKDDDPTQAPIIGVMTQESEFNDTTQELSGSYVNFIQSAGGRVVPIFIDRDDAYYEKMFNQINGLIFPGSWGEKLDISSEYFSKSGYTNVGRKMFELAQKALEKDDYFPILGSCNGFQLLVYLSAGKKNLMQRCFAEDYATTLEFTNFDKLGDTKMFEDAPPELRKALYREKISYQYHNNCLTMQKFESAGLNTIFDVVAKNKDKQGKVEYITLLEGKNAPLYALFIHPESVLDSFNNEDNYCSQSPTSRNAMDAAQHFARFFVFEARKSAHKFPSKKEEDDALIYKYERKYTPHSVDCAPVMYEFPLDKTKIYQYQPSEPES